MRGRRKRVSRNGNRCGSPDDLTDGKPRGVPQYPLDRNMPRKTPCAGCGHRPQGQPLCAPLCARKAQGRTGIPSRQRAALRASWSLADRLRRPAPCQVRRLCRMRRLCRIQSPCRMIRIGHLCRPVSILRRPSVRSPGAVSRGSMQLTSVARHSNTQPMPSC